MKAITLVRFIQSMKILNQYKVKSLTGKLPHHTKVAEISNYTILTTKELEGTLEFTLTLRRFYNRALRIKDHE